MTWPAAGRGCTGSTSRPDNRRTLPLPPEAELVLLRVAQEALANVAKHARASRVGLTLSYMEDQVTLDIRDNGIGFASAVAAASPADRDPRLDGGFGLTGMRERLKEIAGSLAIESEPGGGTAVSASVPVTPAAAAPVPLPSPVPAAVGQRRDPAANRRRSPGRARRAERHVQRGGRVRSRRRGWRRR